MELDDGSVDTSLERRRQEHPVYKLSFKSKTRSSPIFFSEIDIFWGVRYAVVNPVYRHQYSGIASLDISKNLKHLVLSWHQHLLFELGGPSYLHKSFPRLETLTLLLWSGQDSTGFYIIGSNWARHQIGPTMPPEIDLEVNTRDISDEGRDALRNFRAAILEVMTKGMDKYPDWKPPVLKLRIKRHFMEYNGLDSEAGWQRHVDTDSDSDFDIDSDSDEY